MQHLWDSVVARVRREGERGWHFGKLHFVQAIISCTRFLLFIASRRILQDDVQDTAASISLCGKLRLTSMLLLAVHVVRQTARVIYILFLETSQLLQILKSRSLMPSHYKLVVEEVLRTPSLAAAG